MTDLAARLASALADRYVIQRPLGRGGMATVFLARDLKHDRDVAIKVLDPALSAAISGERFHREIQIQAKLRHPHVVTLIDSGDADGLLYYVLTYVEGESLRERLTRAPLELNEALRIWREVVDGIAYAHRHGVAHRDIKPENVLLSEGHALVADFGVAKVLSSAPESGAHNATLTAVGLAVGTPAYMAPEQVAGGEVDHRADVYALGILGYEMVARRPPFVSSSMQSLFAAQVAEEPTPLERLQPNVPSDLAAIIHRCLRKNPGDRWSSADELLAAIDGMATGATSSGSGLARFTATPRSRRRVAIGGAAALAILGVAGYAIASEQSRVRRTREVALPAVRRLTDARIGDSAFLVASEARRVLPRDRELEQLWRRNMWTLPASTIPEGARVSWTAYRGDTSAWTPADLANGDSLALPAQPGASAAFVLLKIEKPGFATLMLPLTAARAHRGPIQLDSAAGADTMMARIPPTTVQLATVEGVTRRVTMSAFAIDRFEVTNDEFRKFVDGGGYITKELWDPFVSEGRRVAWEEGVRRFTDRTGRPGPATWEGGSFPRGQERHPVSGVSWYEAAAYARFAGKRLPTIHQWRTAAGFAGSAWIAARSNYESDASRPVGAGGMGPYGTFDMAGNVREWCVNLDARGARRHILGGGWKDFPWAFSDRSTNDPFDRSPANGFRLVRSLERDSNTALLDAPAPRGERDYTQAQPVSDAEFRAFAPIYDYDHTPLNVRVEVRDSSNADWIRETVTFDATYGERIMAHVVLPKRARPPYQTVVFLPGGNAFSPGPSEVLLQFLPFLPNSGRAVIYPVLRNTFERITDPAMFASGAVHNMSGELMGPNTYRDQLVMMMKDLRRTVDYLATRSDIDSTKLAYLGYSWGARIGPIALGVERRFKLAVLHIGGLMTAPRRPEVDEFNFLPRVRVPTLVLSGRYDDVFPLDRTVLPFVQLLGTPAESKRHMVYPTQHFLPRDQQIAETLNWLDAHFGTVAR
jgi:formylglycine-generating enzyme required for sulfatase activity/dienelactone hydrolase